MGRWRWGRRRGRRETSRLDNERRNGVIEFIISIHNASSIFNALIYFQKHFSFHYYEYVRTRFVRFKSGKYSPFSTFPYPFTPN